MDEKQVPETQEPEEEMRPPRVRIDRERLKLVMHRRGFTDKSLADATGKHANSIQRLKRVQSMPLGEFAELCDALQCHPFDLIVAEGYPEPFSLAPASR